MAHRALFGKGAGESSGNRSHNTGSGQPVVQGLSSYRRPAYPGPLTTLPGFAPV